jgi:hypothetical protein
LNHAVTELKEDGAYRAWHVATDDLGAASGGDLYHSVSPDGVNYTGRGQVLFRGATYDARHMDDPLVVTGRDGHLLYYSATSAGGLRTIACATSVDPGDDASPDGIRWRKEGVVIEPGRQGEFDAAYVRLPVVVFDGHTFAMFYTAAESQEAETRTGFAVSPDGMRWYKCGEVETLRDCSVVGALKEEDSYEVWFRTGSDTGLSEFKYAASEDQGR